MTKGYEQRKASNERYLKTLDEIKVRIPKGQKEIIKAAAARAGMSVNAYIQQAIAEKMERDERG